MGRKKKVVESDQVITEEFSIVDALDAQEEAKGKEVSKNAEEEATPRVYKNTTYCELCGKQIDSTPYTIRLTTLTSMATWHRNCSADKLSICRDCAAELNGLIDAFMLSKNKSLNKFPVEEKKQEEVVEETSVNESEESPECDSEEDVEKLPE